MDSSVLCYIIFASFLLLQPLLSTATLRTLKFRDPDLLIEPSLSDHVSPTEYFEVTKPIDLPAAKPCTLSVLKHDFVYTLGKPPVLAHYSPPSICSFQKFSKIVLEWSASSRGRQFDRIFGVWLGGIELLRGCTAEPKRSGIAWKVEKDITRYSSLLSMNQTLAVYLGNLVDRVYTGVYHVKIKFHFYPLIEHGKNQKNLNFAPGFGSWADKIIPISRNLPLNDGLWFQIQNSKDLESMEVEIPRNTYRAVLEIYLSFHENDEFWYLNPSNDYIAANNLTETPGNGPFREVFATLDGDIVGVVWPFTVIYTGGVNPLLWRPITGIGSFNLPSYDIELTPFLGKMLNRKSHRFGFRVTNALNVWYVCANLHLWMDHKRKETEGKLVEFSTLPPLTTIVSDFHGLNGTLTTALSRSIYAAGWVRSSHGKVTTYHSQEFSYKNFMVFADNGSMQTVNQTVQLNDSVSVQPSFSSSSTYLIGSFEKFHLYLHSKDVERGNGTVLSLSNVTLGFEEEMMKGFRNDFSFGSLKNSQKGVGEMVVKGGRVRSGWGATRQVYDYEQEGDCYFRDVSSFNYTILHDVSRSSCYKRRMLGSNSSSDRSIHSFCHQTV